MKGDLKFQKIAKGL